MNGEPFYMVNKKQKQSRIKDPSTITLTDCLGTGMKPKRPISYGSWGEFSGMMPKRTINTPQRHKGYGSCGNPVVRDNYCLLQ